MSATFGRSTTNLKMGLVGLPNVGKSYLFNSLTNANVPSESYPFCTIEPTEARATVIDPRLKHLIDVYKPEKVTTSYLSCIDIAGLVKGCSTGAGLGNAFLANIKGVDGIYHILRAFHDERVEHVEKTVDPVRDSMIIHQELRIKDYEILARAKDAKISVVTKNPKERLKLDTVYAIRKALECLESDRDIKQATWTDDQARLLSQFQLLTAKPVIYLVNMSTADFVGNCQYIPMLREALPKDSVIIPFSGTFEEELTLMESEQERNEYLDSLVTEYSLKHRPESALRHIIASGFSTLGLISYFTAGKKEVRSWTIRKGSNAPTAAAAIHTDFYSSFILAEVRNLSEIIEKGGDAAEVSKKGKDYIVQDGDVINFIVRK